MKPNNFKTAQTPYEFILGPIKIKDGLFMGDELAAKDIEFIISNKVTHVINTVSKVIPNLWERFGIQYLSVNWTEKQQNIFDKKNNAVNAIFDFIEQAMQQGESCLIHSLHGKSRSCAVMVAYLMKKYHWTLDRCLEYITSKKEHLEIRDNYLSQLQQLEKRMMTIYTLSGNWKDCRNDEEVLLRNTYFNAKIVETSNKQPPRSNKKRIQWGEVAVIQNKPQTYGSSTGMSTTMNRFKDSKEKRNSQSKRIKSILKGEENPLEDYEEPRVEEKLIATDTFGAKKDNNFISTINGNIVHVTVNNFITTDKKTEKDKSHLARPYSSDNKERLDNQMRGPKIQPKKNLFYETSFKSPYDTKLATKLATSTGKITKKKEEVKTPVTSYGRPQSANISGERGKINRVGVGVGILDSSSKKEDLIVAGKKRYPSTNPREELYRFK